MAKECQGALTSWGITIILFIVAMEVLGIVAQWLTPLIAVGVFVSFLLTVEALNEHKPTT